MANLLIFLLLSRQTFLNNLIYASAANIRKAKKVSNLSNKTLEAGSGKVHSLPRVAVEIDITFDTVAKIQ